MAWNWTGIINCVRMTLPAHQNLQVSKQPYVHPLQDGFALSIGDSKDLVPHYRKSLSDGSGIHILEYSDCYLIHWDFVDAVTNPIGHIHQDAPQYVPLMNLAIGLGVLAIIVAGLSFLDL
jgi:hypothetical protein